MHQLSLVISFAAAALVGGNPAHADPTHKLLFDSGKEAYPRYRIPAMIVTKKGTLLAFCEGRKDGGGLTGKQLGVLEMRRHYTNYFRGLPGVKYYRSRLVTTDDPATLLEILEEVKQRYAGAYAE